MIYLFCIRVLIKQARVECQSHKLTVEDPVTLEYITRWGNNTDLGSVGDPDPYLWLMDPDPDPTPNTISFFSDFKETKKNVLHIFSYNLPAGTLSSVIKI